MARFTKVLSYFISEGYGELEAVMLALFFCYYCRFDSTATRDEFVAELVNVSPVFADFNEVKDNVLKTIGNAIT